MEKWYLPITILPGIGLIIISASNLVISLNEEMEDLLKEAVSFEPLINKKLKQMRLLTMSLAGFYISTALMVLSGLVSLAQNYTRKFSEYWGLAILLLGVVLIFASLLILIIYSVKAVSIRQEHFNQCLMDDEDE
jgi:hypothetical protein